MGNTLGQRLRECREEWGETQDMVAKKTGIKRSNLANYETDFRKPRIEQLQILADYYGVSTTYLLTGSEVYNKPELTPQGQLLFNTLRGASEREIAQAVRIIEALKGTMPDAVIKSGVENHIVIR